MTWGTPITAQPSPSPQPVQPPITAQPSPSPQPVQPPQAACDNAGCGNPAFIKLRMGADTNNACVRCAKDALDAGIGASIIGTSEGAPFNEGVRDMILVAWNDAKAVLERAKESEMSIRKAVAAYVFPTPKEGMNNHELGGGYVLKMGHKLNYNITAPNEAVDKAEDEAAKLGNEGVFLFERVITWTPNFSKSEYNKLDPSLPAHAGVKKLVDGLLEIKPGSPSLEIKEPKATLNG